MSIMSDSLGCKGARLDQDISTCDPVGFASALVEHLDLDVVSGGFAIHSQSHVMMSIRITAIWTVLKTDRHTNECMCGCSNNNTSACVVAQITEPPQRLF